MTKVDVVFENGNLEIDYQQADSHEELNLSLSNEDHCFKFTKVVSSDAITEGMADYHFSLALSPILENILRTASTIDDVLAARLTVYQDYQVQTELAESPENEQPFVRDVHKTLTLRKNTDFSLNHIDTYWDDAHEHCLTPYVTRKGALAFLVDRPVRGVQYVPYKMIRNMVFQESGMRVTGCFDVNYFQLADAHLEIVERGGDHRVELPVSFSFNEQRNSYKRRYDYQIDLEVETLRPFLEQFPDAEEQSLDLFIVGELAGTDAAMSFRVGNPKFMANYTMKGQLACLSADQTHWISLVPYLTLKATNLSFTFNVYEKEAYDYFRAHQNNWKQVAKQGRDRNIWIIGERSYKAQDNGYHFFKYLREHRPEVEAYYVIRKNSPELKNVAPLGNVIFFNSREHFEKVMQAKYICGTHHPDSLYPTRSRQYISRITAKKVFLQHGVFGTKNIAPIYGKWVNEFYTDLFITSSRKEKQIAITDLGYSDQEVAVTGLARFDTLFANDLPVKRQLLIIPTWRDWITNDEIFEQSDYLQRYRELLFDPRLKAFSEKFHIELIFCLHPNMQDYVEYFQDAPVTIVRQGDVNVQDLIKESMIMLTDYSSVAFDFSFLHKPVIYYQFDRSRFLGKYPSHLDLDSELPGPITDQLDQIFAYLDASGERDFQMRPEDVVKADRFIDHRDTQSSDRIYQAVLKIPDKTRSEKLHSNTLYLKIMSKFRRTRRVYFPAMRVAYWWWRHFSPIKENQILFESSLGKRYEDSPRIIYEDMVKTHPDLHYVWVSSSNQPLKANPTTKIIKRLSIDYYRALATSRYWVNNQNFPAYITKRKGTDYLQTWHGTPLKKMQHDQQVIEGRTPGYLKRVTHAKDQWSALVSPSDYATKAFRSAFQYEGPVIEQGYPRNDVFYGPQAQVIRDETRKRLGIADDQKVILYAPTFRDYENVGNKFVMRNELDFDAFEKILGDDHVLLMREHVIVASKLQIPTDYRHNIKNVSNYPSVQELMLASDMLITDYSSIMFDYLNLSRPIYFFCYDLEQYVAERGTYFDFVKEVPGPIVRTADELLESIADSASYWQHYRDAYTNFQNRFTPLDGPHTAAKVVDQFLEMSSEHKD
ncbi:CDP-glycerol glycerophosphotransferase family protein [Lacticaseibacillus mingshuiensis]|uniref:CDP-glycerol glycerophosphotransferase family protein n=1 Tax=Lacticaseibacillus mingshuiensis TaxID=2799574 RepID=A0ABW4CIR7_9LACO|nr:CDP-glycerol glycerophosphotransferase family protein [Lacticaseibacillus mingshuiensis]